MPKSKLDIELLEKLCNEFGPSGHEEEVQRIVRKYGEKYADDIVFDRLGSLAFKKGTTGPKIMLAGHVDEIGFVISEVTKEGYLKFHQLGGWWDQTLLTQQVLLRPFKGAEKIIGVIGAPPPHVLKEEQRNKVVKKEDMWIDIGCSSKEEVEKLGIRVGDPAVPVSKFRIMKRKWIEKDEDNGSKKTREVTLGMAKAFDDRIGVFIALEVLRRLSEEGIDHPNTVYACSTVQEEVGLRGAQTAAKMIEPDLGFALDVDISGDSPGSEGLVQKMGKGVAISAGDSSMIPNPRLRRFVLNVAEETGIRHQAAFLKSGGTDAGAIHLTGMGVPSLFLGIPTRYIHSHNGILDLGDVENAINLLIEIIKRMDEKTTKSFTEI
ncbi:M42 family peptidase [Candidatus Thorarchaeota archaeon]|nr:MAG: M42 family peptidase [Candidatus Thorarchaeota archaeon]